MIASSERPPRTWRRTECVLTGKVLYHRSKREANVEALRALDRAIELDPNYAHARRVEGLRLRARPGCMAGATIGAPSSSRSWSELQIALALDDNDADVHRILAALNLNFNEHDKAVYHKGRALSLNPNSDLIVVQQGEVLTWLGRPAEGIDWVRRAIQLDRGRAERFRARLGRARYGEDRGPMRSPRSAS